MILDIVMTVASGSITRLQPVGDAGRIILPILILLESNLLNEVNELVAQ